MVILVNASLQGVVAFAAVRSFFVTRDHAAGAVHDDSLLAFLDDADAKVELDLESEEEMSVGLLWFPHIPVMRLQTAPTSQSSSLQTQAPSFVVPPDASHSLVNLSSSSFVMDEELALLLDEIEELEDSSLATGIQLVSSQ